MAVRTRQVSIDTTGVAGSAVGNGVIGIPMGAKLLGVFLDFTSLPATTDVTITNLGRQVLAVVNVNTDTFYPVREGVVDKTGAAAAAGDNKWAPYVVSGDVAIAIAQADPVVGGLVVTLVLEF